LLDEEFARGSLIHLRWHDSQGRVLYERHAAPGADVPVETAAAATGDASRAPGAAAVVDGQRVVGRVEVRLAPERSQADLADARLTLLAGMGGLGLLVAVAMAWVAQRRREDLGRLAAQARDLARGEAAESPSRFAGPGSASKALAAIAADLAQAADRIAALDQARKALADELSRQREVDALTGLYDRSAFLGRLQMALADPSRRDGGAGGLLLLRLRHLDAMNLRVGHDAVDGVLRSIAAMTCSYPARVPGALAGRLNGGDFALYLPAPGLTLETAQALWAALRSALLKVDPVADLAIGGVEGLSPGPASQALAAADQALAQAETQGPFPIVVAAAGAVAVADAGADEVGVAARRRIGQALDRGEVRLAERPVRGLDGEPLQIDCRLLYRDLGGALWEEVTPWLQLNVRSRLTQRVELATVARALQASAQDGQIRAVGLALPSLAEPGFVAEGLRLLQVQAVGARRLRVEVSADAAAAHPRWVDALAPWVSAGVSLGLRAEPREAAAPGNIPD
jgi:GGDEF domain-containing protein